MNGKSSHALATVILIAALGCGGDLVDVRARLTLDGEPLESAAVTLVSTGDVRNRSAYGTTDSEGRVRFSTFKAEDGVLPGAYKVVVTKAPDNTEQEMANFDPDDPEDVKRILMLESGNFVPFIRTSLPRVYTSAAHTPLSCEVPSAEELTFDLDSSLAKKKRDRSN